MHIQSFFQVSTWFANARRRLKKENKMTWSPRNRSEDGSENGDHPDDLDVDTERSRNHDDDDVGPLSPGREIDVINGLTSSNSRPSSPLSGESKIVLVIFLLASKPTSILAYTLSTLKLSCLLVLYVTVDITGYIYMPISK